MPKNPDEIGALWEREAKSGDMYMSGLIEIAGVKHPIVCFRNSFHEEGDNKPTWRVLKSRPRDSDGSDDIGF